MNKGAKSEGSIAWTQEAQARLERVPEGALRELTRQRVENLARQLNQPLVTVELVEAKYEQWTEGSARASSQMTWTPEALRRVERIPEIVRGMVVQAVETYAHQQGLAEVTPQVLDEAKSVWGATGRFHHL